MMKNTNPAPDTNQNQRYANRQLSLLQFHERVLDEAKDLNNPLFERLNFASIFQSNLDEFYMVRVGMLLDSLDDGVTDDKLGMTSEEQISIILERTKTLLAERDKIYRDLMRELRNYGVELCSFNSLPDKTQAFLEKYFISDVLPLLSPQIIGRKQPFPFLRHKSVYAVALLKGKNGNDRMGIVPCGEASKRSLIPVPGEGLRFVLMEDLIVQFLPKIFVHFKVDSPVLIRLVRNADIHVDEGSSADDMSAEEYRENMEKLVRRRKKLNPVKVEYRGKLNDNIRTSLLRNLEVPKKHLFASGIPLDLSFLSFLKDILRDKSELFYPRRVPQNSFNVDPSASIIKQIRKRDILLSYPYESIRPLMRLLQEAGQDPNVVSIKMTLYRVASNSKIVEALVDAAENGKEVVVLVELRARFDEENNIGWSRVLEQAGCRVIYGLDGMKVHSKLLLITRKHKDHIEYITQVGTGNYNEDTVRLYTDFALMTASPELGMEAAQVFNCLSMGEIVEDTHYLLVAPACLRSRILEMIDSEIEYARNRNPAYLGFKMNGLSDKGMIDKIIEASQNGVHVDLLVRGICCLVGGIPGVSENIHVCSIVGRYLEHGRIYIFGTEERRKVYISSADFMTRNTMHRVEVAAPIYDEELRRRIVTMFFDELRDTAKLRVQQPNGIYQHQKVEGTPFNSQEYFFDQAYNGSWALPQTKKEPKEKDKEKSSSSAKIKKAKQEKIETQETEQNEAGIPTPDSEPVDTLPQPDQKAAPKTPPKTAPKPPAVKSRPAVSKHPAVVRRPEPEPGKLNSLIALLRRKK